MTLNEALNEQMKDESFKKEYDALGPEYEIISSLIDARKACNVTQKQLSETTGIAQSDISKIENGSKNIKKISRRSWYEFKNRIHSKISVCNELKHPNIHFKADGKSAPATV